MIYGLRDETVPQRQGGAEVRQRERIKVPSEKVEDKRPHKTPLACLYHSPCDSPDLVSSFFGDLSIIKLCVRMIINHT